MPKASARQQAIDAMVEATSPLLYLDGLRVAVGDDPQRDKQRRAEWEALSDRMLEHERLRLSAWLGGKEIGAPVFEHEQSHREVSSKAGKKNVQKRRQRLDDTIVRGRRLRAENPNIPKGRAYDKLGLSGIYKFSYFARWIWPEIIGPIGC